MPAMERIANYPQHRAGGPADDRQGAARRGCEDRALCDRPDASKSVDNDSMPSPASQSCLVAVTNRQRLWHQLERAGSRCSTSRGKGYNRNHKRGTD